MPQTGPCTGALQFTVEEPAPDFSGSVLCDVNFTGDGVSLHETGCDGPVNSLHTRNTSNRTAWALLPDKKRGNPWVQMAPGFDTTTTAQGQLNNLGLTSASDVRSVTVTFTSPV